MTKLHGVARCLSSILLASSALAGCAGDGGGDGAPPAPPPVAEPAAPGAHVVVGSYVAHMRPRENRIEISRVRTELAGAEPGKLTPQGLTSASIVSNSVAGSGPGNTVELDTISTTDTYGSSVAVGSCPAGAFCGDVTLTHFFPGLNLSAVYAQITGIADSSANVLHNHNAVNGVSSTPFGLDLTYGAWSYTASMGTLGSNVGATKTWAFANPDDSDFYIYLDVYAALYPMLWFDTAANGGITQTAPLVAGQPAIVHYMYARNSACRGSSWSMQGYLKGANIDVHTTSWPGVAADTYFDQHMIMPFGTGVGFWFNNTDSGCNVYDSNGGANYNYGVSNVTPTLHFTGPNASTSPYSTSNWAWFSDSALHGGLTVSVDYEMDRVLCGSLDRYGRVPAGTTVLMHTSFDNGAFDAGVSLVGLPYDVPSALNGSSGQVYVPPQISIPAGSHKTSLYFESTGPGACHNYDSNFSNNYVFTY
jgi:hypothetical protein